MCVSLVMPGKVDTVNGVGAFVVMFPAVVLLALNSVGYVVQGYLTSNIVGNEIEFAVGVAMLVFKCEQYQLLIIIFLRTYFYF